MPTPTEAVPEDLTTWKAKVDKQLEALTRASLSRPALAVESGPLPVTGDGSILAVNDAEDLRTVIYQGVVSQEEWVGGVWLPIPGGANPVAPPSSPTPITRGGLRQIFQLIEPVPNPTLVSYEYHVTDVFGAADPVPGDPATLIQDSPATMAVATQLPGGTPFVYDWDDDADSGTPDVPKDYYFSVIARSGDQYAAPSPWVAGRMDKTASGDLVAGSVTTELLNSVLAILGRLLVGSGLIELSPPTSEDDGDGGFTLGGGIIVADPANPSGEPLVRLHPMGCSFRGRLTADIITVLYDLIINGDARLSGGSTFELATGIPDPLDGPAWTVGQIQTTWPVVPAGYVERGIFWDSTASRWLRLLVPTSGSKSGTCKVQRITAAGAFSSEITLANVTSGVAETDFNGIVRIGSSYYSMVYDNETAFTGYESWVTAKWSTAGVLEDIFGGLGGTDPAVRHTVGVAGSSLLVAWATTSLYVWEVDASDWSLIGNVTAGDIDMTGRSTNLTYIRLDDFDFGTDRLVYAEGANVWVAEDIAGTYTEQADESFPLPSSVFPGGFAWGGVHFFSTHGDGTLREHSDYYPASDGVWSAEHVDNTAGGTTAPSPFTTATIGKRQYATLTLPDAPDGVVDSDVWVGYAASGDAATKYLRSETFSDRTIVLEDGKQTSGSTVIPSVSTAGGSPAILKSEEDDFSVAGTGAGHWKRYEIDETADYWDWTAISTSAFVDYATSDDEPQFRVRFGILQIKGVVKPALAANVTAVNGTSVVANCLLGTLPADVFARIVAGAEPMMFKCHGSGTSDFALRLKPDGQIYLYRYSGTATTSTYMGFCVSYHLEDA